jgi:hypothetical protein
LKELSVKSRVRGAAGGDEGVDANGGVGAGATHTVDAARGFRARADVGGALVATLDGVGREVGVTGEAGTGWVGAGAVGIGADPTNDASPG